MATTTNRGYPLPVPENYVSADVLLLIQATELIDADIASILASLGTKANALHGHSIGDIVGLATALSGKAAVDHIHSLDDLSDVSGAGAAPNNFVLVKSGGQWSPQPASSLAGAHTHAISDITNLQAALDSKITAAQIAGLGLKGSPVDADSVVLVDSADSNALKRITWASIKAALKTYFDTLYTAAGFGVQTGTIHEYAGDTAPTGYYLCFGQEANRTTDAALFAIIGTKFGPGDGTTTFNLPDRRGRTGVGRDDMGGTAANRLGATLTGTRGSTANGIVTGLSSTVGLSVGMLAFGTGIAAGATILSIDSATQVTLSANHSATGSGSIRFAVVDGATVGAVGGAATHKLTVGQMPAHAHNAGTVISGRNTSTGGGEQIVYSGSSNPTSSTGGDQAHPIMQPSIVMNYIIKR